MPFSILQASPSSVPTSVESTITGRLAHFTTSKIPIPNEARPKIEVIDVRIRSGNRWLNSAPSTPPKRTAPALIKGPVTTAVLLFIIPDNGIIMTRKQGKGLQIRILFAYRFHLAQVCQR
jgi:hypothetical protein